MMDSQTLPGFGKSIIYSLSNNKFRDVYESKLVRVYGGKAFHVYGGNFLLKYWQRKFPRDFYWKKFTLGITKNSVKNEEDKKI